MEKFVPDFSDGASTDPKDYLHPVAEFVLTGLGIIAVVVSVIGILIWMCIVMVATTVNHFYLRIRMDRLTVMVANFALWTGIITAGYQLGKHFH